MFGEVGQKGILSSLFRNSQVEAHRFSITRLSVKLGVKINKRMVNRQFKQDIVYFSVALCHREPHREKTLDYSSIKSI